MAYSTFSQNQLLENVTQFPPLPRNSFNQAYYNNFQPVREFNYAIPPPPTMGPMFSQGGQASNNLQQRSYVDALMNSNYPPQMQAPGPKPIYTANNVQNGNFMMPQGNNNYGYSNYYNMGSNLNMSLPTMGDAFNSSFTDYAAQAKPNLLPIGYGINGVGLARQALSWPPIRNMENEVFKLDEAASAPYEGNEVVVLNLGDYLVKQLEDKFADPHVLYPKRYFQPIVEMPIAFARQLYTFYLLSMNQNAQDEIVRNILAGQYIQEYPQNQEVNPIQEVVPQIMPEREDPQIMPEREDPWWIKVSDEWINDNCTTLDLPFLAVASAMQKLDTYLDKNIILLRTSLEKKYTFLDIITGRAARHGQGDIPKIRYAAMQLLKERNIYIHNRRSTEGKFIIEIMKQTKLRSEL